MAVEIAVFGFLLRPQLREGDVCGLMVISGRTWFGAELANRLATCPQGWPGAGTARCSEAWVWIDAGLHFIEPASGLGIGASNLHPVGLGFCTGKQAVGGDDTMLLADLLG